MEHDKCQDRSAHVTTQGNPLGILRMQCVSKYAVLGNEKYKNSHGGPRVTIRVLSQEQDGDVLGALVI